MIVENFGAEILQTERRTRPNKIRRNRFCRRSETATSQFHRASDSSRNTRRLVSGTRESENPNGIAIIDAALMIESGGWERFHKLIVVFCEPALQLERLMTRNNLSETEAIKRINSQMPQDEKKKYADFLIDTSNGFEDTRRQTIEIYKRLKLIQIEK